MSRLARFGRGALRLAAFVTLLLPAAATRAGGSGGPVPVFFGPNIDLSVVSYSQGVVQRETTIAVNPANPANIVEGNKDHVPKPTDSNCSFSFTFDGGGTWTFGGPVPLEAGGDLTSDPAIAADATGNFYYSYLDSSPDGVRYDVVVAKSSDGGRTFPRLTVVFHGTGNPSIPPFALPDKDYLAVDGQPRSPFLGSMYVAWTDLTPVRQIQVSVSRDGGTTWAAPTGVGPIVTRSDESVLDALPVVAPDGSVYLFYDDAFDGTGPTTRIRFSRSADGGQTWAPPADVASGLVAPGVFRLKNSVPHWETSDSYGIYASPYPSAAIAPDGTLFVAWTDVSRGSCLSAGTLFPPCTNSDVRLAVSKNGGKTWTAPVRVSNDGGSADQFNPWIAVHPNGLLSLTWQDKRLDPDNVNFDTFYTNTSDAASFLRNVRVTTATSLAGNGLTAVNDYIGLAASADGVFATWTDLRSGNPDAFTATAHFVP